jgi:hypothetical protein
VRQIEPWLGSTAAEVVERLSATAAAAALALYVTGGLYRYLQRELAAQLAGMSNGSIGPATPVRAQRVVWLYDATCRIFLGRSSP